MANKQEQIAELLAGALTPQEEAQDAAPAPVEAEIADDMPLDAASDEQAPEMETQGDQEEAQEETQDAQPTDEEVALPETMASLAEAIGVEPEYLYGIKVPLSDSGEQITVGELKDRLQEKDREIRSLQEAPKAEPQAPATQNAQLLEQANTVKEQLESGWKEFMASKDWKDVVEKEPARAVLMMQDYQQRQQEVQSAIEHATKGIAEDRQALVRSTVQAIPEWSDSTIMNAELNGMAGWLADNGVSQARIKQETDPKMMKILRSAWKASTTAPAPKPTGLTPLNPRSSHAPAQTPQSVAKKIVQYGKAQKGNRGKADAIAQLLATTSNARKR